MYLTNLSNQKAPFSDIMRTVFLFYICIILWGGDDYAENIKLLCFWGHECNISD